MTSVRGYHRCIIATALFGAAAAITGIILLILNIAMPGTICLIAGAVIGLIAGMESRYRDRPLPVYNVKPLTDIVIIPSNALTLQQPLDVK